MRRISKSRGDEKWLGALGKHIEELIKSKGYRSVYDFWVSKAGDYMSRATLNYIVAGTGDPKVSTLRIIAKLLGLKVDELLRF